MRSVQHAILALCFFALFPGVSLASQDNLPLFLTDKSLSVEPLLKSDPFWQRVLDVPLFFEHKALELPPTHPAFSLNFPLSFTRRVLWDTGYILTAPARWDKWGWAKFSLFAAATSGVMSLDHEIDEESRRESPRSSGEADFENTFEDIAGAPGVLGVIGGSYLFGFLFDNEKAKDIATDMAETLLIGGLLFTELSLKNVVGRARPEALKGTFRLDPFWGSGRRSLPSGHATNAFAMASVLSEHFHNSLWVALPAYGLATMVGVARVRANGHFASDVFIGAVIGTVIGRTVVSLERERETHQGRVAFVPMIGPEGGGLGVIVRF